MLVSASIVLFRNSLSECQKILNCLDTSLIDHIILVDHSGDERLAVLKNYSPKIEYIPHENRGYGAGHNVAIRKSIELNSDYHLVVNADITFEPGTIEKIVSFMEEHPEVGHLMPKVFYPDGRLQYLCKLLPTPWDMFARGFLPERWIRRGQRKFTLAFSGYDMIMNAPYLSGCFMFIRTKVFQEIGCFDERYFMYPEDADLTRRIHEKYKTVFFPGASIVHNHIAAHRKSLRMKKVMIENMIRYFNKWGWLLDRQRQEFNRTLLAELKAAGKDMY